MTKTKIALVYFSGTNVTHEYAEVMQTALTEFGAQVTMFNLTPYASRQKEFPAAKFDGIIFGFPVYGDFIPSPMQDWLKTLHAEGKRCAQFFTYGARTSGYAHFHTQQLLEQAGFDVMLSAEFLGRHTYNVAGWTVIPQRPDETDFFIAREFTSLALERFTAENPPHFHLQKPFGYGQRMAALEKRQKPSERGWTHPVREGDCRMCRICEDECPTQAFDADSGLSDFTTCIACMHCLYICPDKVIKIDERMGGTYENFKADWHLTDELMEAKRSKIFTEAWQAAA